MSRDVKKEFSVFAYKANEMAKTSSTSAGALDSDWSAEERGGARGAQVLRPDQAIVEAAPGVDHAQLLHLETLGRSPPTWMAADPFNADFDEMLRLSPQIRLRPYSVARSSRNKFRSNSMKLGKPAHQPPSLSLSLSLFFSLSFYLTSHLYTCVHVRISTRIRSYPRPCVRIACIRSNICLFIPPCLHTFIHVAMCVF